MSAVQASLFDPPAPVPDRPHVIVAHNAPLTSIEAARKAFPKSGSRRMAVLRAIALSEDGLTDHEIAAKCRMLLSSVNGRRHELVDQGFVEDSTKRRESEWGGRGIVWCLSEAGRENWAKIEGAA